MMSHNKCPLCGQKEIRRLAKYDCCNLYKCRGCTFTFSLKIPDDKKLDELYNNYGDFHNISGLTINRYDVLLSFIEKYKQTKKILDFGCGAGYFLERSILKGWEAYGIERDKESIIVCKTKGIKIIEGNGLNINYHNFFDVIILSEVVEHLSFPKEQLITLATYLRTGGIIYITTPNFNSLSRRILKTSWSEVFCFPEHLSYFTPVTLKKVLNSCGFKPINLKAHGINMSLFRIVPNKRKEIQVDAKDETIRTITEEKAILKYSKKIINFLLSLTRLGDTIKCIAIKKQ